MRFIARFMLVFGLISSLFDILTFTTLRFVFHAGPELFRTTWFVESLLTELAVALVVRTRRPFFRSRPGRLLVGTTAGVAAVAVALPYLPGASALGFVPLSAPILVSVLLIAGAYVAATELGKVWFFGGRSVPERRENRFATP